MKREFLYPLLIGLLLMALGTSAKAIIDVAILKSENKTIKEVVMEIKDDVKYIRRHYTRGKDEY